MKPSTRDAGLELSGLDGSNPLAFLVAIGTLRVLTLGMPGSDVKLRWRKSNGAWRPAISAAENLASDSVIDRLVNQLSTMRDHPALARWDNLSVRGDDFRAYAVESVNAATSQDRIWADYAAAFACETTLTADRKAPVVQDTAFRTIGGGRQT
ncbi:MAG: type I-G CRISPR-associated protein, Cas3-extension family, partial [Burkholderiales bacterium]